MRHARLALAAFCATAAARQDHLCAEDVCFYHIPKTGGDSFKYLLRDELKRNGHTFWSNEWCPRRSNGTSTMVFREPRAHVVSQYFECRDSEWALGNKAKWEGLHGAFPRNRTKSDAYRPARSRTATPRAVRRSSAASGERSAHSPRSPLPSLA